MQSTVRDHSTVDVVLGGDLDMAAAFQLENELDRLLAGPGVCTVVLDLDEIEFVDSTGLGALLSIKDRATQLRIRLRVAHASASVQRILELTGTRSVLEG
jgi:anti-anti-sigma factor